MRRVAGEPGVWIIIIGDLAMFSLMFGTFLFYRRADVLLFQHSQTKLNQFFGLTNTLLMLTSSWFVAMGVNAARQARFRAAGAWLSAALLCGVSFVVVKMLEYGEKIHAGIVINSNDFFVYYYMLTGIHLGHVLIGMLVLTYLVRSLRNGNIDAARLGHVESGAMFWHLVDLLWIALFALLYLLP